MKSGKNVLEFEVLGFKVKFKPEGEDQSVSASEVVECVNNEANNLKNDFPQLSQGELSVLLALHFAKKNIAVEKEYKSNIQQLNKKACDALSLVETISPPSS
ncbi:MAG: hypothetical protein CME68_02970 [Halobacteriovoraceae bacterium]|nr:hypothetical protein [Halobacteriovoraceae bacterium]|tara:strand:- start:166 stop:471 length:306 start_codon:yes stop_codon:yes gene_type:complete